MEATRSSETSVNLQWTTRSYILKVELSTQWPVLNRVSDKYGTSLGILSKLYRSRTFRGNISRYLDFYIVFI
jgi:hypothetical protein